MIVDPAIVGFAVDRGVGDRDDRDGQSGVLGVRGQQHRTQRRLAEQPAPFVEPQQHFRTAVDPSHAAGIGQIRCARIALTANMIDLHCRVTRAQSTVADEPREGARPDRIAELGHLVQTGRAVDRPVHQQRSRRA